MVEGRRLSGVECVERHTCGVWSGSMGDGGKPELAHKSEATRSYTGAGREGECAASRAHRRTTPRRFQRARPQERMRPPSPYRTYREEWI